MVNSQGLCCVQRHWHKCKKPASLKVYTNNKKYGVKYLVLPCPTIFIQTLNDMCLDTEMVHLYNYFVPSRSILISTYWKEACAMNKDKLEADDTWKEGAFALTMKEYKNCVLSSKHSVATRDVVCSYLQKSLNKPDNMTLKAFKAWSEVLLKLYDNLNATYKLTIGNKEKNLIFFKAFSADHWNVFIQQKNRVLQNINGWISQILLDLSFIRPACLQTMQTRGCSKENTRRLTKNQGRMLLTKGILLINTKTHQELTLW